MTNAIELNDNDLEHVSAGLTSIPPQIVTTGNGGVDDTLGGWHNTFVNTAAYIESWHPSNWFGGGAKGRAK